MLDPIRKWFKERVDCLMANFSEVGLTLFGLHGYMLYETATFHPQMWDKLHVTMSFMMAAAFIKNCRRRTK